MTRRKMANNTVNNNDQLEQTISTVIFVKNKQSQPNAPFKIPLSSSFNSFSGRENKDVNNTAIDLWQPLAILTMSFGFRHKTVRVIHPRATLLIEGGFILYLFIFLGILNPYPKALLYLSSQNSHYLPFSIREIYYFLKKKCKLFCRYS